MSKPISHQLDIYGAWIHLARTRGEWKRLRSLHGLDVCKVEHVGLTQRFVKPDGAVHLAVYLNLELLEGAGLVEIVGHESAHAAGMLLDHCEAPYDGESEPFAYLVGFLAAWLWTGCQKR